MLCKIITKTVSTIVTCLVLPLCALSCVSVPEEQRHTTGSTYSDDETVLTEDNAADTELKAGETGTIPGYDTTEEEPGHMLPDTKENESELTNAQTSETSSQPSSLLCEESENHSCMESPLFVFEYPCLKANEENNPDLIPGVPDVVFKPLPEEKKADKEAKKIAESDKKKKQQTHKKEKVKAEKNVQKIIKKQESPEPVQEIIAKPGDDIEISLKKVGWIFHGYENSSDARSFSLVSKQTGYGETLFLFKAVRPCAIHLRFSLQDNYSGIEQQEVISIKVVDAEEISTGMENASDIYKRTNTAEVFYEAGNYEDALKEYLKQYQDGSCFLNDRLAELYCRLGDYEKAAFYWKKNIQGDHEYGEKAISHLFRLAIEQKKGNDISSLLHELFCTDALPLYSDMIEAMKVLEELKEYNTAITMLERYLAGYIGHTGKDYLYYILAGFYERDTAQRNLKNSRFYYEKVCREFPESPFAIPSAERITYLNRHFFFIK